MAIKRDKQTSVTQLHRRYFELCIFTQVAQELKSGDLFIVGSDDYADYREQLVSWEKYNPAGCMKPSIFSTVS